MRQAAHEPDKETAPTHAVPLLREFVEGEWKEAHFERYKPSTKKGVRSLLAGRILPAFGSKRLDRITPARLRRWFDAFSRTAPGNANHDYSLGWRLTRSGSGPGSLELSLEARRRESANDDVAPEHGIGFKVTGRF